MIIFIPSCVNYNVNGFLKAFIHQRNADRLRFYQDKKMPDYESAKNSVCIVDNAEMLLDDNIVKTIIDLYYRNAPEGIYSYIILPNYETLEKFGLSNDDFENIKNLYGKEFKYFTLHYLYTTNTLDTIYSTLRDYRVNKFSKHPSTVESLRVLFSDAKLPRDFKEDEPELFVNDDTSQDEKVEEKPKGIRAKYLNMEENNPYRNIEVITKLAGNYAKINFKDLIERQRYIWMRYESPKIYNLKKNNATEFIKELDKYLFNIIEEIAEVIEVKTNFNDNEYKLKREYDKNELIEEVIDVFNYSATTLSILVTSYKYFKEDVPINVLLKEQTFKVDLKVYYTDDQMNNDLITILNNVVSIRRLFGERKWHKPHPIATDEANMTRLILSIYYITNAMKTAAKILFNIVNSYASIDTLINKKFSFIVDLPDVKQEDNIIPSLDDESELQETSEPLKNEVEKIDFLNLDENRNIVSLD